MVVVHMERNNELITAKTINFSYLLNCDRSKEDLLQIPIPTTAWWWVVSYLGTYDRYSSIGWGRYGTLGGLRPEACGRISYR